MRISPILQRSKRLETGLVPCPGAPEVLIRSPQRLFLSPPTSQSPSPPIPSPYKRVTPGVGCPHSVAFLQPAGDAAPEPQAGAVHLPALRCQPGPAADDPDLPQLAGGLHQQLPEQLCSQRLLRAPVGRHPQVGPRASAAENWEAGWGVHGRGRHGRGHAGKATPSSPRRKTRPLAFMNKRP